MKLFERNNGNVTLTPAGTDLYNKLNEAANIINGTSEKKEFNIGCIRSIADTHIADAIKVFHETHPDIKVNVCFDNNSALYQMIKKDELDILVCRYPLFYKFDKHVVIEKIKDIAFGQPQGDRYRLKNSEHYDR